jgi:hypothetical protein
MAPSDPTAGPGATTGDGPTDAASAPTSAVPVLTEQAPLSTPSEPAVAPPAGGPLASRVVELDSPSTLASSPGSLASVTRFAAEPPTYTYSRHAQTPLPYFLGTAVVAAVTTFVVRWAVQPLDAPHSGGLSTSWWDRVQIFYLQAENLQADLTDHGRLTWAAVALTVLAVSLVVWIRRIGQNAKADSGYFGAVLAVAGLFGWWTLPFYIGHERPEYGEIRFRLALAALLVLIQAIFARWAFTHKIWRAGNLPFEPIAYLLWIPQMVATFWFAGATAFTMFAVGKHGDKHSSWRPTEAMARLWQWSTRGTALAVAILLVAVTVVQHIGIAADKAARADYEGRRA